MSPYTKTKTKINATTKVRVIASTNDILEACFLINTKTTSNFSKTCFVLVKTKTEKKCKSILKLKLLLFQKYY